jgi:hypothetical protein
MMNLLIAHALNGIRRFMFFKLEAYKNENEYRFQQLFRYGKPAPAVKYRQQPSSLVRYYREFDWRRNAPSALKKIVIGLAADRDKANRSPEIALRHSMPIRGASNLSTRTSLIVCDQARRPRVGKGARVSSGSHCETSFGATAEMDRQGK